jgi:hypothetical protein
MVPNIPVSNGISQRVQPNVLKLCKLRIALSYFLSKTSNSKLA